MYSVTQKEFDELAIFVAVASELRQEPFFSEDNHDSLCRVGDNLFHAFFGHPAFLKSAVLPFRKLWLKSEPCAFEMIRDFVFKVFPDQSFAHQQFFWFYTNYDRQLAQIVGDHADLTVKDVLEIWLYTHAVHAGPKSALKKQAAKNPHRTLGEFDRWVETLGREKFEYSFRLNLRVIGSIFAAFEKELAGPLLCRLKLERGMRPGFEVQSALTYNPYPDARFRITFDDPFWHLNKESFEETFDRLLARQHFNSLGRLLLNFFNTRASAVAAVCAFSTLEAFFAGTGTSFLTEGDVTEKLLRCSGGGGTSLGAVDFEVYDGRAIRIEQPALQELACHYFAFREQLFDERNRQGKLCGSPYQPKWGQ